MKKYGQIQGFLFFKLFENKSLEIKIQFLVTFNLEIFKYCRLERKYNQNQLMIRKTNKVIPINILDRTVNTGSNKCNNNNSKIMEDQKYLLEDMQVNIGRRT